MLYLARSLSQLHFGSLMAVYADANRENGRETGHNRRNGGTDGGKAA